MHESIAKYLAGEMGDEERLAFEAQLGEDIALQNELFIQLNLLESTSESDLSFDSQKAYAKVESEINRTKVVTMPRKKSFSFLKIAATLLIVLTAGFFLSKNIETDSPAEVLAFESQDFIKTFELSDGTLVRLNSNSKLIVDTDFGKSNRKVQLVGAANFDVTSNPDKPFIITANTGTVEVLGTSFEVEAYPEQEVELSVSEGKVKFASNTAEKEDLFVAGEKGVLSADGQELTKLELKNSNFSAWWTKRLVFEATPLNEVFADLEKTYNVTIEYSSELKNCKYGAILENYTLDEAIETIQLSFSNIISVEKKDSLIKLEGTACNN